MPGRRLTLRKRILRDLAGIPREEIKTQDEHRILVDVMNAVREINPMLRSIIRDQGHWDLDRLEERARGVLEDEERD